MTTEGSAADAGRLIGWKRIAAHVGCSERTARRWEAEEGLPVHRQVHEARSTVYALPSELDAWIWSRAPDTLDPAAVRKPGRLSPTIWPWVAGITIVVLLALNISGFLDLRRETASPLPTVEAAPLSENVQALDLYERGLSLWQQRGKEPNRRAILLLTEAVEQDEDFAEAWAALASAWATYPSYDEAADVTAALDRAILAADRALRLKPELAEPRTLMAEIAERRGDWVAARDIYDDAMARDPDNPTIYLWAAGHKREAGYMEDALRLTREALRLEPNYPPALNELAMNTAFYIDATEGRRQLEVLWNEHGLEMPVTWFGRWMVLLGQGEFDEMQAWQAECPMREDCAYFDRAREVYRRGDRDETEAFVGGIVEAYGEGLPAQMAISLIQETGDTDAMLTIAERESEKGRFLNAVIFYDPSNAAFRAGPRFTGIVRQLGLLDYWRKAGPPDFCSNGPAADVCRELGDER
ncbi:hypothetical protein [Henriciella sp.]|uniref:hypothetical protein n=1 Tax=Henriciella sp. TaxID=1968823 RepID=UPI0026051002|nr:hypothetical protein [Henriciella sp.]